MRMNRLYVTDVHRRAFEVLPRKDHWTSERYKDKKG